MRRVLDRRRGGSSSARTSGTCARHGDAAPLPAAAGARRSGSAATARPRSGAPPSRARGGFRSRIPRRDVGRAPRSCRASTSSHAACRSCATTPPSGRTDPIDVCFSPFAERAGDVVDELHAGWIARRHVGRSGPPADTRQAWIDGGTGWTKSSSRLARNVFISGSAEQRLERRHVAACCTAMPRSTPHGSASTARRKAERGRSTARRVPAGLQFVVDDQMRPPGATRAAKFVRCARVVSFQSAAGAEDVKPGYRGSRRMNSARSTAAGNIAIAPACASARSSTAHSGPGGGHRGANPASGVDVARPCLADRLAISFRFHHSCNYGSASCSAAPSGCSAR